MKYKKYLVCRFNVSFLFVILFAMCFFVANSSRVANAAPVCYSGQACAQLNCSGYPSSYDCWSVSTELTCFNTFDGTVNNTGGGACGTLYGWVLPFVCWYPEGDCGGVIANTSCTFK